MTLMTRSKILQNRRRVLTHLTFLAIPKTLRPVGEVEAGTVTEVVAEDEMAEKIETRISSHRPQNLKRLLKLRLMTPNARMTLAMKSHPEVVVDDVELEVVAVGEQPIVPLQIHQMSVTSALHERSEKSEVTTLSRSFERKMKRPSNSLPSFSTTSLVRWAS
jgi:hypothetical protein